MIIRVPFLSQFIHATKFKTRSTGDFDFHSSFFQIANKHTKSKKIYFKPNQIEKLKINFTMFMKNLLIALVLSYSIETTSGVLVIGAAGDPHFTTWSGDTFDFHGVCDLVLLQNPDFDNKLGMNIHIRTKETSQLFSYIDSTAVQIGNDVLEVMGGKDENNFWVNKVKGLSNKPMFLSGYPITFEKINDKSKKFVLDLGFDEQIVIKTWNSMVSVSISYSNSTQFSKSLGMMGSFPLGLKLARNNSTVIDDLDAFGQEWQVLQTESKLFHKIDGPKFPIKCKIPSSGDMRRRLSEFSISRNDAELSCTGVSKEYFEFCVFDVMATNDKDSVGAY